MVLISLFAVLVPIVLLVTACIYLWQLRWNLNQDGDWEHPLPPGSMGLPFFGETFHWLLQGSDFHASRRKQHGHVFKTHLLGRPVVRVTGAEHLRRLLLEEHNLVGANWPRSAQAILGSSSLANSIGDIHRHRRKVVYSRVFSHSALESYLPQIKQVVAETVRDWCTRECPVAVYTESKELTFRIAVAVLLGSSLDKEELTDLFIVFEQLTKNIFSLPLDIPGSGYRKGIKARDKLHQYFEKTIEDMLQFSHCKEYSNALGILIKSSKENGMEMSMQELKEAMVELMFAAYATTASAATSLILQLLKNPAVLTKLRMDLQTNGFWPESATKEDMLRLSEVTHLQYLDGVVKEVLRLLPPVSGGYRVALQTFELGGFQIPKGWSVMYSIRDTHDTAPIFQDPEIFNPDRFAKDQMKDKNVRFQYLPFGGGVRRCLGKELAKLILKVLAIELASVSHWELATKTFPKMLMVPIVHPADGLKVQFSSQLCNKNDRPSESQGEGTSAGASGRARQDNSLEGCGSRGQGEADVDNERQNLEDCQEDNDSHGHPDTLEGIGGASLDDTLEPILSVGTLSDEVEEEGKTASNTVSLLPTVTCASSDTGTAVTAQAQENERLERMAAALEAQNALMHSGQ
uniref:cytochrome P450 26B1-like n=1 Tax=Pristiophorus japonicus TaxID=55135 RepID=UPI00398F569D